MKRTTNLTSALLVAIMAFGGATNMMAHEDFSVPESTLDLCTAATVLPEGNYNTSRSGKNQYSVTDDYVVLNPMALSDSKTAINGWCVSTCGRASATTWTAPEGSPFKGSDYWVEGGSAPVAVVNGGTADRKITVRVTNCTAVSALFAETKYTQLVAYELKSDGTIDTESPIAESKGDATTFVASITGLSPAKTYIVGVESTDGTNRQVREIAFAINNSECKPEGKKTVTVFEMDFAKFAEEKRDESGASNGWSSTDITYENAGKLDYLNDDNTVSNLQFYHITAPFSLPQVFSVYPNKDFQLGLSYSSSSYSAGLIAKRSAGTNNVAVEVKTGQKVTIVSSTLPQLKSYTQCVEQSSSETTAYTFKYGGKDRTVEALTTVYTATADGTQSFQFATGTSILSIKVEGEDVVPAISVKAGYNGYTAFSDTKAFAFEGAKAYYVGKVTGETAELTEIAAGSVIAAGQGIIFKAENMDDDITVTYYTQENTTLDGNRLIGVGSAGDALTATGTNYVLASDTNAEPVTTGFFIYTGEADALVGKCYLNVPESTSPAKALKISFGGTDGIKDVKAAGRRMQEDGVIYDLNGCRTVKGTGLIIKNGKKYIIK